MINLKSPEIKELKPKITVFGVGGAGGNAVNNMIRSGLEGCEFVVANTDSQALTSSRASRLIQMGVAVTEGLGAGSQPEIGRAAAEEVIDEIMDHLSGSHMIFVTAGMGGGTGTGAAPIIARTAREQGILTVGVVTKPFHFEGQRRMRVADSGINELQQHVDTLIVIPNQNLFRIATDKTTFADAFAMADQVLYSGVACITDLMVKEGLINLDFADVRSVMREMGKAMMGTGEASGASRATQAAEAAIANPLLDETSMKGAKGLLISITGGKDLTLFEVDEAATRIREEVDQDANIILGATFDESLEGVIRVSVVATGIDSEALEAATPKDQRVADMTQRLKTASQPSAPARTPSISTAAPARPAAVAAAAPPLARTIPAPSAVQAVAQAVAPVPAAAPAPAMSVEQELEIQPAAATVTSLRPVAEMPAPAAEQAAAAPAMTEAPVAAQAQEAPASRMPRIEDFPPVVQAEIRVHQRQAAEAAHEDRGPLSILKRLAQVGLGRRDEEEYVPPPPRQTARPAQAPARPAMPPQARPAQPAPQPPRQVAAQPAPRPVQPRPVPQEGLYRPRQAELDAHGRPIPRSDEDPLEIPAFLRRQAN